MQTITIHSRLKFTFNPDNSRLQAILAHYQKAWVLGISTMHDLMKVIITNWLWDKKTTMNGKTFEELEIVVVNEKDFDDFVLEYDPLNSQVNNDAPFDGKLFDWTEDADAEYVRLHHASNIWTLIEAGDDMIIQNGIWKVNRLGYFVTAKQWEGESGAIQFVVKR